MNVAPYGRHTNGQGSSHMHRRIISLGLSALWAGSIASAQNARTIPRVPFAVLTGIVTDSVHLGPLAGAHITVVGANRTARANHDGVFRIDSIPPGTYTVQVDHPLLDSLGLRLVAPKVTLAPGKVSGVFFQTPSAATIARNYCGAKAGASDSDGVVLGRVTDGTSATPVGGAIVALGWPGVRGNDLRAVGMTPHIKHGLSGSDGMYAFCKVPTNIDLSLSANDTARTSAVVHVSLRERHLAITGLGLSSGLTPAPASSRADAGELTDLHRPERATSTQSDADKSGSWSAPLFGYVTDASGAPIPDALVEVAHAGARTRTDTTGAFVFRALTPGQQLLEVHKFGYAAAAQSVNLNGTTPVQVAVTMDTSTARLAAVSVIAAATRNAFTYRRHMGLGRFITQEQIEARHPSQFTDVLMNVLTLSVIPTARGVFVVPSRGASTINGAGGACVSLGIDGVRVGGGLNTTPGGFDLSVQPTNVAAVEIYTGATVPPEFGHIMTPCSAVVLVWTKNMMPQ